MFRRFFPNYLKSNEDNNNNTNETDNGAMQASMVLVLRIRPDLILPRT